MEKIGNNDKFISDNAYRGKSINAATIIEEAKQDTIFWAREYFTTEAQFAKRTKTESISEKEFLKWEDDANYNYQKMIESEEKSNFSSRYERDRTEKIGLLNPNESIEATAGDYYFERSRALNNAIKQSNSNTKEEDLEIVQSLFTFVAEYIYASIDYETRRHNVDAYHQRRMGAHNELIKHLNRLNNLAEQYSVRRFTFRNFETNDSFRYIRALDTGGYTDSRSEYDRGTVASYCRRAFSDEFEKAKREKL